ncbi:hypothetical protein RN629_08490 [Sphingomonadaceae bacterium jetA1]|jgi:hypothetical protein|uniref:hypothetical protein n=1 Tax=Facivitalis istanbulensis TaxID=3075838 RepID=UPI00348EA642
MKHILILPALILAAACTPKASDAPTNNHAASADAPVARPTATGPAGDGAAFSGVAKPKAPDYVGRWIGVEGMVLDVKHSGTPGRYRLAMQWNLEDHGEFMGEAVGDTIVFEREGVRETLRPTDGDATELKWLADKKHCLTVKPGEGYCRD